MSTFAHILRAGRFEETPLWYTSDVAQYLGCSERQVFELRKLGLPAQRIGWRIRFIPARVRAWVEANEALLNGESGPAD
jgi:hypothetical protein